ncbi:MAG: hypothetical protein E7291_05505 [Lachnospiraceae bacterium]|nr:hypothetical protein [Lachnospiraceae bacterium]
MAQYQRSEYLVLSDKIYVCRQQKKMLEERLEKTEFQYKCVPQQKDYYSMEVKSGMLSDIVFAVAGIAAGISMFYCLGILIRGSAADNKSAGIAGIVFLLSLLIFSYAGIHCISNWSKKFQYMSKMHHIDEQQESMYIQITQLKDKIEKLDEEIQEYERRLCHEISGDFK